MKAYKVFDQDWNCRGYQYEIGKTYEMEESPVLCHRGFHACIKAIDCFNYKDFDSNNKVAEVDLIGIVVGLDGDKQATNKITIVREIKWTELLDMVNTGSGNTGYRNSGYRNSGDRNSGDRNSGDRNSGDWNSGDQNSGDQNSGYQNSGDRNSGDRNSGDRNSGDQNSGYRNSGDWNSGDFHTGVFNSEPAKKAYAFNKLLAMSEIKKIRSSPGANVCERFRLLKYRVRTQSGKYGGYRYLSYKASWRHFWESLSRKEKLDVVSMPHFQPNVFAEITGISLKKIEMYYKVSKIGEDNE